MATKVRKGTKRSAPTRRKPSPVARARQAKMLAANIASLDYVNNLPAATPVRKFKDTIPSISEEELELAYRYSGLVRKGINKKARDALRKGFWIVPDAEDREDSEELNAEAREWMRRVGYTPKAMKALREMFTFGDGFLELGYDGSTPLAQPPSKAAVPSAVYNVDPYAILPVKDERGVIISYLSGTDVRLVNRELVKKFAAGGEVPRGFTALHPERIQHFEGISIRENPDGLNSSVIEAAYINLLAKLAGDNSAGDILEWYSKGFYTVSTEYASDEELKATLAQLDAAKKARKNYFVGTERTTFDIKSPATPNVVQFYDNFAVEIAAALEMPTMVLLGVQKGTVTGSGTDLTEYYDDVHSFQSLLLETPMLEMLRRVLKRDDFSIEFNQLFVDKQTEADVMFKRSQAAVGLFGGRVLSRAEAIRYLRDGDLPNPDEVPDGYAAESGAAAPAPTPEGDGADEDAEAALADSANGPIRIPAVLPLEDEDRRQIEALAAQERQLGEEILKDWEDAGT